MTALATIFAAGFASTFLLGFQSRNVNHGHYGWAFATALAIGLTQTLLWGALLRSLTFAGAAAYAVSSAIGITAAMLVHQRFVGSAK